VTCMATAVMLWLSPHMPAALALPVTLYAVVISGMVITAFGARGAGVTALVLVGALLFFLSDVSVASQRLLQADFPTYVWGLPLYYAGQVCLALSAAQSRSHCG
jgi:uncharacterized membrane protein YhhN